MTILIGLLLKSLAIAAIALLALRLTRSRSAAERSLIAHLGLLALVALPLATLVLPSLDMPLPEAMRSQIAPIESVPARVSDAAPPATSDKPVASNFQVASPATTSPQVAPGLRALVPYAYAVPVLALLLLTIAALFRLVRLRAEAEVLVDPVWLSALAHAQRRMGHKSGTALLISETLPSPISWGLARPTILLSVDALAASDEAEAIIAHELAHVAAFDWLKLMLARVATAIHWFNPLAWRLAREAHQLREEAADDMVLDAKIAAPDYAQLLVRVARHENKGLVLGAHGVAPGRGSLKRRVGRVLDATLPRTPARGSWVAGFFAGMLVMAAPLAALTVNSAHEADADPASFAAATTRDTSVRNAAAPLSRAAKAVAPHAAAMPAAIPATPAAIAAAAPAPAGQAQDHRDTKEKPDSAIETIVAAKATGVTPDYIASIRRAAPQLGRVTLEEATAMRSLGVTAEYVAALAASGMRNVTADNIVAARAVGVNPAYVRSMAAEGFHGSVDDYVSLAALGVTAEDVRSYRRAGIPLEADELTARKATGSHPRPNPNPDPDPND